MATGKAYSGSVRKLVLGIDVGTTFSGISYCLLDPGRIPSILPVTRFPAQESIGGDSKVPSVVYYDRSGDARAMGAEAQQESVQEQATEEGWQKSAWFKLHLRPTANQTLSSTPLPPLPDNKTAVQIMADFFRYLLHCARSYIQETYTRGTALWIALEDGIEFIISHPNGWEGAQQASLRKAAIIAGLIPNSSAGHKQIHFVTEGEASLHFCIKNGLATDSLRRGQGVVVVDAGGGTVDISTYRKVNTRMGEAFEEISPPDCLFKGSIFVSEAARNYLKTKLRGSKFADEIDHITECFDKTTKIRVRGTDEWSFIKFGRPKDKDVQFNINGGQLKLPGKDVASFFVPSIAAIFQAITKQKALAQTPVSSVLLVGGFAASDMLYSGLKECLEPLGLELSRPDSHVNKAVADGAVSFYLDHFVSARIAKNTDGVKVLVQYQPQNAEHRTRSMSLQRSASGEWEVPNGFSAILQKNTRVSVEREFRQSYHLSDKMPTKLGAIKLPIYRYSGVNEDPRWIDTEPGNYSVICTVQANTSRAAKSLRALQGSNGPYYKLDIEVILSFGLTELKAQIAWVENGEEQRGPAQIVYD
ncbi:hypothetical protein C8J57DRAFT_1281001 [Mycena rebaudengoi]|nr:hypothetical protein C8J57DRAFT_1281001 [Mycena rebaudengoi]